MIMLIVVSKVEMTESQWTFVDVTTIKLPNLIDNSNHQKYMQSVVLNQELRICPLDKV